MKSFIEKISLPLSIIIAGGLIAGGFYLRNTKGPAGTSAESRVAEQSANLDQMKPIDKDDHILGNPNAPVKIVEYSDMECPFCKSFHPTMQKIMDEYGTGGKVAWVYRHFPLDEIHSNARPEAVAAECANELGGNSMFWKYITRFFEVTPSNNQTDIKTVIPEVAKEVGLNSEQFATCLTSGKYDKHIQNDLDNAIATGGQGTPWNIIVTETGDKYPLAGAQPYASVKQIIDLLLQGK